MEQPHPNGLTAPSYRIVVADDEPEMQEYFRKLLVRLGHQVAGVCGTGQQLLEHCRLVHPDLIITDVHMPELDGLAATALYCRERATPILLVTAYPDTRHLERAETAHVMGCLVKPIHEASLPSAITAAMNRFRQKEIAERKRH